MHIPWIELEITHRCNKYCKGCNHRVETSDYDYMTLDEYDYIVSCVGDEFEVVTLIGGEPLLYPDLKELVRRIERDFKGADTIHIFTNGRLIPHNEWLFDVDRVTVTVSRYADWNEDIIEEYKDRISVYTPTWRDVDFDPDLDEETAKCIRWNCRFDMRILGTKLYNCCLAEPVERHYGLSPVHIQLDADWRDKIMDIPTWKACMHCFTCGVQHKKYYEVGTET